MNYLWVSNFQFFLMKNWFRKENNNNYTIIFWSLGKHYLPFPFLFSSSFPFFILSIATTKHGVTSIFAQIALMLKQLGPRKYYHSKSFTFFSLVQSNGGDGISSLLFPSFLFPPPISKHSAGRALITWDPPLYIIKELF